MVSSKKGLQKLLDFIFDLSSIDNYHKIINILADKIRDKDLLGDLIGRINSCYNDVYEMNVTDDSIKFIDEDGNNVLFVKITDHSIIIIDYQRGVNYYLYFENKNTNIYINREGKVQYFEFELGKLIESHEREEIEGKKYYTVNHYSFDKVYTSKSIIDPINNESSEYYFINNVRKVILINNFYQKYSTSFAQCEITKDNYNARVNNLKKAN